MMPTGVAQKEQEWPSVEEPRKLRARTVDDKASVIGAGFGSFALAWIITEQLVPVHGWFGLVVCWYFCFLAFYAGVTAIGNPRTVVIDRLVSAIVHGGAVMVGIALFGSILFIFWKGAPALPHVNFYADDMSGVRENDPLSRGGILHAIVGSLIEISIAVAITVPLGVGTAVFMTEVGGRFARVVRTVVEAMTALPSVVAGLFIYSVLIVTLHFPRTGFAAAMAMSVMMLPIIARASDVVLRVVPGGLREAGLALGSTQWRTLWHVVLPTAAPGPGHRGHPRCRPRHRRDVAGAADVRRVYLPPHRSAAQRDELAAAVHLLRGSQRRSEVRHPWVRRRGGPPLHRSLPVCHSSAARPPEGWAVMIRRWVAGLLGVAFVALSIGIGSPASAAGAAHGPIEGSGSSWSANAVSQWIADVNSQGLQVVFTASGSAQGRKDYAFGNVDFAVSDIAYQGTDPLTHETDASNRPYVYLPIVAGGTSFPYQIRVAGKLVKNLRLSGQTIAKIFTNAITNWNDPQITADNNGRQLPSIPIIPVVHSEGSGSTAQFTAYMAAEDASIWGPYNGGHDVMTEYYPRKGSRMVSQNGSDGVMNFVTSSAANGAIGFDEYSYALNASYPVAKLENSAGYFTLPTQYNVAKTLTQAQLDNNPNSPTYLIENLSQVYTYNDPRTYPMSSYSYMILPTGVAPADRRMSTLKRQTLVDFMYYAICTGQRQMGPIGYSPLPVNLVQDGFAQLAKLKTADPKVDITQRDVSTCNNPTFVAGHPDENYLAQIAPLPLACDKVGAGPCSADAVAPTPTSSTGTGTGTPGGTNSGTGTPTGTGASAGPGGVAGVGSGNGTGVGTSNQPGGGTPTAVPDDQIVTVPATLASAPNNAILTPLVILELLAVLVVPVVLQHVLSRRSRS